LARPRTFHDGTVLDAAVECFWRRGLEATSVRELGAVMRLNAPSLYNAFGDKRALFLAALERYAATTLRPRLDRLAANPSPRASILDFFDEIISRSVADPERRGCFVINTALDAAPHDAGIAKAINAYFSEIEAFFRDRLIAARETCEVASAIEPPEVARLLLGLLIAIRVLARTGATRATLESMARPALAMLEPPTLAAKTNPNPARKDFDR
jgi:TetR/AcrR family transcriptional repressor of nem operon